MTRGHRACGARPSIEYRKEYLIIIIIIIIIIMKGGDGGGGGAGVPAIIRAAGANYQD